MYRLTTKFLPRLGSKSHNTPSKKNLVTSVPSRDQVKTQVSPPDARNALRNLCSNPEAQKNGIHGYKIVKMAEVPELAMTGVVLQHEATGAQHCHFARDDPNNMFSVMFRTTPTDSTGVAHILEHTTLCGSNKYPVRDPFFKMLNRSLATFMNALTGRDYTMYPFTTQNKKDYFNLMSVYLDAVFNPQLRELDFRQEGWRLEHAVTSDPSTPITFKGVVYNEMKGVYSDSQSMYFQEAQSALLPENTYGCSYGGDPKYITDLSWQQLRDFHGDHYHPSNSKFLTYGNLPLEEVLQETDSYLVKFERNDNIDTKVTNQPRWTEPRSHHVSCAPDPMAPDPNKQTTVSISYLLNDITDLEEEFTLGVICHLLVSGESAPFYQALLGANIGADYSPITGYDCYMKEGSFSVGLRGIAEGDIDKVKAIIKDTIDDVIKNGFDQKNVDAYLHKLEIGQKEQTTNFGVMIAMGLSSYYNHDADPLECVQINKAVQRFRNKMADNPEYLQQKVQQYFKDNQHHLVVVMTPRESYEQERDAEEESRLEDMVQTLSEKDRTNILDTGIKLQELQTGNEDLSCLPTLKIEDIDKKIKPEFADSMFLEGVPVQICEQPTNGLTYVRMVTSMSKVPPELAYLVPLFCNVITRMDAGDMNYQQLSQKIDLYTGGLDAGVHVTSHPMDTHMVEQSVVFSSKCLDRNVDKMLDIWKAIFNGYNLKNRDRLLTLINMTAAEMSSSVVSSGHSFAMSYAKSSLQPADAASEGFSGMTQLKTMKVIAEGDNVSHEKIREHLEEIAMYVLNKENMRVSINATRNHLNDTISKMSEVVGDIHGRTEDPHFLFTNPSFHPHANYTQFEMPFSVNFMSNAIQTVPISHKDYPVLKVLSKLLWSKYLHKEIREKGGAYGSGAVCGHGTFTFFSYRDPNSTKTLDTFADSIKWVLTGDFSDTDVEEAKLSVFQEVDKPVKPGDAGMKLFLSHLDDILRQEIRDGYFRVDKASIIRAAEQYLLPGKGTNAMSFLGPANETIQQDSKWNVIRT